MFGGTYSWFRLFLNPNNQGLSWDRMSRSLLSQFMLLSFTWSRTNNGQTLVSLMTLHRSSITTKLNSTLNNLYRILPYKSFRVVHSLLLMYIYLYVCEYIEHYRAYKTKTVWILCAIDAFSWHSFFGEKHHCSHQLGAIKSRLFSV